jgi:hypothetical protein
VTKVYSDTVGEWLLIWLIYYRFLVGASGLVVDDDTEERSLVEQCVYKGALRNALHKSLDDWWDSFKKPTNKNKMTIQEASAVIDYIRILENSKYCIPQDNTHI